MHFELTKLAVILSAAVGAQASVWIESTYDFGTASHVCPQFNHRYGSASVLEKYVNQVSRQSAAWYTSKEKAISSALSTFSTHLTVQPQYSAAGFGYAQFLATAKGIPAVATATDRTTTVTAAPTWYKDLPKDLKSYMSSVEAAQASIVSSVIHNAAPAPTPCPGYEKAAGMVVAGAIGAAALFV